MTDDELEVLLASYIRTALMLNMDREARTFNAVWLEHRREMSDT